MAASQTDARASARPRGQGSARAAHAGDAARLTSREFEVLQLIGTGATNQQIADALVVGVSTVKTHANNLFAKLQVSSRKQAVAAAHERQLI